LKPEPIMGSINIFSEPMETVGARIFLNGEEKGNTPLVVPLLVGNYDLKLAFDGYLDSNEKFTLTEGENKTIKVNMLTYSGSIKQKRISGRSRNGSLSELSRLQQLREDIFSIQVTITTMIISLKDQLRTLKALMTKSFLQTETGISLFQSLWHHWDISSIHGIRRAAIKVN
jgi:hypothetical protein